MEAMAASQVGSVSYRVVGAGPCAALRECRHGNGVAFLSARAVSSSRNSAAALSCCFSGGGVSGNGSAWTGRSSASASASAAAAARRLLRGFGEADEGKPRSRRGRRCAGAAQEAAQTEEGTEELEEDESEEGEGTSSVNGGPKDAAPSFLEDFKAAVLANDEERVAKLEAEWIEGQAGGEANAKQVAALTEESQNAKDRLLRLNADFDNFRKRSQNEKANVSTMVKSDVMESLLPMVDNFERAKTSIKLETESEEKIDKSYQNIYKQFVEIMKGLGVVAVETVGKPFDPNVHEAIMREESTEFGEDVVIQEFRRGFSLGGKLMRPAMVKVSAGPGPSNNGDDGSENVLSQEDKGGEA